MWYILLYFLVAFAGFAAGRIGHILGGDTKSPHHWIYGFLLIIPSVFYRNNFLLLLLASFGAGMFVSDLKDFLHLKFYGADDVKIKKFWGID